MGSLLSIQSATSPNKNFDSTAAPTSYFNDFINKEINSHDIVVFSKTNCSYCKRAKSVLDNMSQAYHVIELDVNSQCPREDCQSLTRSLILLTQMKTVPQIFVRGKLVGGFFELDSLIKQNRFETLFK